jgi:microsomal dipeptidase-like Zn-dependent dipeptidase
MVGPAHVGIGLDTVFDATELNAYCRARPDEWPMTRDPNWSGFNYALPEQLAELTDLMARAGYPESAIRQILGENYVRIVSQVWA